MGFSKGSINVKILIAITNDNKPKTLAKNTLRWAPRAGFDIRVFIPDETKLSEYQAIIEHLNYDEFMDLQYVMLISDQSAVQYAKDNQYELILMLPDNLKSWNKTRNKDLMLLEYAKDIGVARQTFTDKKKITHEFSNGATMVRKKG